MKKISDILNRGKNMCFYIIVAALIGALIGVIDSVFGQVLLHIGQLRTGKMVWLTLLLPVAGVGIMLLYRQLSRESLRGMTLVFEAGYGEREKIPKMLVPLVILATWITHLFGGSAGREGVAVQLGATVAHTVGRKVKLPGGSRIFLVAGMAAGFAGLFQTPVAATFFAMEVLIAGTVLYEALIPAMVAAFMASGVSHMLGLEKSFILIQTPISYEASTVWKFVVIGILFGIVGGAFAKGLSLAKKIAADKIENPLLRIFLGGCVLAVLLLLVHTGRYSGLGTNLISESLNQGTVYSYDWLLKGLFTIVTLAVGFQGGEVTPLFSIGASLGAVLGMLLGLPPELAAALGYAAVFGGGTNTLLAPILIGAEIFGTDHILLFVVVCSLAYVCNGNKSIYGAQKKFSYLMEENQEDTLMGMDDMNQKPKAEKQH